MRKIRWSGISWLLLFLVWPLGAAATVTPPVPPPPAPQITPQEAPMRSEVVVHATSKNPFKGKLSISAEWFMDITGGILNPSWQRRSARGNFYSITVPLRINYGVTKNFQATFRMPLKINWARDDNFPGPAGERNASFGGVGDIGFICKYLLVDETSWLPSVTTYFSADFPTGHYRRLNPGRLQMDLLGNGSFDFITGFNFFKEVKQFYFFSNLWYSMATSSRRNFDGEWFSLHFRDKAIFNLGAEYNFTDKFGILLEFYSQFDGGRLFGHQANVPPAALIGILPELDFTLSRHWNVSLGVAIDLAGKNTTFAYSPTIYAKYKF